MGRFDYMGEVGSYAYSAVTIASMSDKDLEKEINKLDYWDMQLIRDLCWRADMIDEYEATDDFEDVAYKAAEKLGLEI